jgi:glycosyltransferase involved in cell wall biosynthesis
VTLSFDPVVSIGLPARNAESTIAGVIRSVLAQDYERIELVISDNASTDGTEAICRDFAESDARVSYHRQPENIGLLNNFVHAMRVAQGALFRWIGDDDSLEPDYVSRCVRAFEADPRLLLVTTGIAYTGMDGKTDAERYDGMALASDDPVERFAEMLRLLNASYLLIDPLYAMMRRDQVMAIERRNMLREDEVFATKLALAGPWGHIPDVLAHRHWSNSPKTALAKRLDVPAWRSYFSSVLQCREILAWLNHVDLTDGQRTQARRLVYRMYANRQQRTVSHRGRKLVRVATGR